MLDKMSKKKVFFVLFLLGVAGFIVLLLKKPMDDSRVEISFPAPTKYVPTPTLEPQTIKPPVAYLPGSLEKLQQLRKNKGLLSEKDRAIRNAFIESLDDKTGFLFSSQNIRIEYVKSPDDFEVEILIADIAGAKQEAISWFYGRGASKEGLCNMPVIFYLNWAISDSLRGSDTMFNPLPDGC